MGLRESFWKKLGVEETGERGVNTGNEDNNSQFREIVVRNNGKTERKIVPVITRKVVGGR